MNSEQSDAEEFYEEFDPEPIERREPEVLAILACHVMALNCSHLGRLKSEGVVLVNLKALADDRELAPNDLQITFMGEDESVEDVENRTGLDWVSTFDWMLNEVFDSIDTGPLDDVRRAVLKDLLEFNWFKLVTWASEERWLQQG